MRFQKRFRYAEPFLSLPEAVAHLSVPVEEAACIDSILVSLRISFRSLDIDDEFRSEIENLLKTGIAVGITIGHHENLPDPVLRRHLIQEQAQGFGLTRFPVKQIVIDGNAGLIDQDGHGHLNLIVLVVPVGVERAQRVGVPCIEPAVVTTQGAVFTVRSKCFSIWRFR